MDKLGKTVLERPIGEGQFEIPIDLQSVQLSYGSYFVRVILEGTVLTEPVIIVR
jgi:hypothetical protein